MKLENQTYTRLDDDVSFQILRTNPKLTTNTKLMYDGENIYMEAYGADPLLVTRPYKAQKISRMGLFNNDIKNFLSGASSTAYTVGQNMSDLTLGSTFDNQFETMYWCGVESLPAYAYEQEMGCIAPLYLRKKLPDYFVIFKMDTPANTNTATGDESYDFTSDILKQARIIKTFSLKEGTPIGDYIKRYVGQKDFKYDQSIYVNFSSNEIYYYGIDRYKGVLTQKVENIKEQMLDNDYTVLRTDERITCGFERNDLIFPYILNLEFLFDDDETEEYHFARYFGMYCNAIDLQEVTVDGIGDTNKLHVDWSDSDFWKMSVDDNSFYYIRDKYDTLYSLDSGMYVKGDIDINTCMGYETSSVSVPVESIDGLGYSTMVIQVLNAPDAGSQMKVTVKNSDGKEIKNYISSDQLEAKAFNSSGYFSSQGTMSDIAEAIAGVLNTYKPRDYYADPIDEFDWMTTYTIDDKVFIEATYAGTGYDGMMDVTVTDEMIKLTDTFCGGTNVEGCLFKVSSDDVQMFISETEDRKRYIKSKKNKPYASVKAVLPYHSDYYELDENYSTIVTDWYGPYIKISKNGKVEILDKFYAKIGLLSFFPVRDFDTDTIDSAYGDGSMMENELNGLSNNDSTEDSEVDGSVVSIDIPYGRFFTENGETLNTEYDYFCENIIPELSIVSKTVPYIDKWGYMDEAKDSCENPYRLNTSKIFETCNFSSNTFMTEGDILEYTHSMPYYIVNKNDKASSVNEYQYIVDKNLLTAGYDASFKTYVKTWTDWFLDKETDHFDDMFGDCSDTKFYSKRFNKKYSRFLKGSGTLRASTLFRGVKFEVIELMSGKEVKTGKYNDYKFSFIYIPSKTFSSKVYFVKNEVFKFIVGMIFFKVSDTLFDTSEDGEEQTVPFGKANAYAGSLGYMKPYDEDDGDSDSDYNN